MCQMPLSIFWAADQSFSTRQHFGKAWLVACLLLVINCYLLLVTCRLKFSLFRFVANQMDRHRSRSGSGRHRKRDRRSDSRRSRRPVATASRRREMPNRWSRDLPEGREGRDGRERDAEPTRNRWDRGQNDRNDREMRGDSERSSRRDALQPLPRPGFDKDKRLAQLNDDPRYHPGAELGKAQKAAMGIKGLHGRNTASFDPRSTLVRPAMRIIYGRKGHELGSITKPDDVIVVPELICDASDQSVANRVLADLKKSEKLDPKDIAAVRSLTARMCQYFQVDHDDALVLVRWHQSSSSAAIELCSRGFGKKLGRRDQVMLHMSLGATCELAFKRARTGEVVYFPQKNGTLMLLGCDVDTKWHAGESKVPDGMNILVSVWGRSRKAVEEEQLASSVSSATKDSLWQLGREWKICKHSFWEVFLCTYICVYMCIYIPM